MSASNKATTSDLLVATPMPCQTAQPFPGVPNNSQPFFSCDLRSSITDGELVHCI